MKTLTPIAILVIVLIAIFIAFQFLGDKEEKEEVEQETSSLAEQASQGTLPDIEPVSNPVEELKDINPAAQTNPFGGGYKNPFSGE